MSDDPNLNSLYHPENPAAIITRAPGVLPGQAAPGMRQFVWGMIASGLSLALAILAPISGIFFMLLLTLVGIAFGVMGAVQGGSQLAEAKAVGSAATAYKLGRFCRVLGFVAVAVNLLSGAAWAAVAVFGIRPIF